MKKSDLRATLGSVGAHETQIERVMATVAARREREERRANTSWLNFGMRLATAACAFMIVVGLGIYAFSNDLFKTPDAVDYGAQRANEADNIAPLAETQNNSHGDASGEDALVALLAESEKIDGDWAIIRGVANAFYFAGGEEEGSAYRCVIAVSVENVRKTSDGIVVEDEIIADVCFLDDGELNSFTDSISSEIVLLVERNGEDHDTAWTVKKIIY